MEKSVLIQGLKEIDPSKPYGTELYDALARLTITVAIEAVCMRLNPVNQKIEVYLTQRSQQETAYPGEWHCPGSALRPGEKIEDVFFRLQEKEFGSHVHLGKKRFVINVNNLTEARGHFLLLVYLCELVDDDVRNWDVSRLKGKWFPVNQLPDKTVESHRKDIIPAALGEFKPITPI